MSGNSNASNNSNDERQYTLIEHGGMKYYLNERTRKIYMLSKGRYIYFGKLKPGASVQNFTVKQIDQNSEDDEDDDVADDDEDEEEEDEKVVITYYGMKFTLDQSNGNILDIKTNKIIGKLWEDNPLKIVFYILVQPLLPLVKLSERFEFDKKFDVYEKNKQVGYLLKVDIPSLQLKEGVLTTIGKFDVISLDKKLYVLLVGVSKTEGEFNEKIKSLKGIKEEIRLIQEQKRLEKSDLERQLTTKLATITRKLLDIVEEQKLETNPEKSFALKKQRIQQEKERLAIDNSIKSSMLKTLRNNIASIRQLNGDLAAKSAGEEYLKQKSRFETETKAQEQKIQHLELELESEVFNTDNSTETVEMTEVDYFGKVYLIDMKSKDVYEHSEDDYKLVGKVIEDSPIKIKFFKSADWKEEYADLEPREYKGIQYVVNPITKNVFLLDTETHVGEIVTLEPLVLHIYDQVNVPLENVKELEPTKEEEGEEMIEVEIIVFQGTKFVRGPHGFIYNKKFELVGKWDYIDKQIDYIPTRSFLNFSSSCYIDSLLFALFYRSSSFIEKQILRKDIHSMLRTLRIADPSIKSAINENQKELVKIYKWLHRLEQTENSTRVCIPFRTIYKNVELEKKPIAYHDKLIETHLGDSSEFLIGLFNGFGVKTMVKTLKASGKEGDEIREYNNYTEQIPPIILVNSRSVPDNYYQNTTVSVDSQGKKFTVYNITDEDDLEGEKEILARIKIEKINILLEFFKSKLRISKTDRESMKSRIEEISRSKIVEAGFKDIESIFSLLNTTKNYYPKELKQLEQSIEVNTTILEKLVELAQLREKYKFEFTEKIDDIIYRPIDGIEQDYIILSVDRGNQKGKDFVRDKTPFNLQETIASPIGEPLELEFVIKYIDSPKHYVCYFKNIEDDLWYLYDDRYKTFKIVTTGKLDKTPGTFEKMKAEVSTNCTVLFYAKGLI
jgi:hypothetical protein